ncbi:hypothetical protein MSAN_00228300 [Mycena sanguinolenta]|uniref:Uncharacterized protein n=1 Tax=Mycena sanguinolenta TaxID=230812 RepID=A0A8H6ZIA5_9AGAR|nr:hypothetical protein MSAN_00228300 [Mycena sanguinolenta]
MRKRIFSHSTRAVSQLATCPPDTPKTKCADNLSPPPLLWHTRPHDTALPLHLAPTAGVLHRQAHPRRVIPATHLHILQSHRPCRLRHDVEPTYGAISQLPTRLRRRRFATGECANPRPMRFKLAHHHLLQRTRLVVVQSRTSRHPHLRIAQAFGAINASCSKEHLRVQRADVGAVPDIDRYRRGLSRHAYPTFRLLIVQSQRTCPSRQCSMLRATAERTAARPQRISACTSTTTLAYGRAGVLEVHSARPPPFREWSRVLVLVLRAQTLHSHASGRLSTVYTNLVCLVIQCLLGVPPPSLQCLWPQILRSCPSPGTTFELAPSGSCALLPSTFAILSKQPWGHSLAASFLARADICFRRRRQHRQLVEVAHALATLLCFTVTSVTAALVPPGRIGKDPRALELLDASNEFVPLLPSRL